METHQIAARLINGLHCPEKQHIHREASLESALFPVAELARCVLNESRSSRVAPGASPLEQAAPPTRVSAPTQSTAVS